MLTFSFILNLTVSLSKRLLTSIGIYHDIRKYCNNKLQMSYFHSVISNTDSTLPSSPTAPMVREMPLKLALRHCMLCVTSCSCSQKITWPLFVPSLLKNSSISLAPPSISPTFESLSFSLFKNTWKSWEASKFP